MRHLVVLILLAGALPRLFAQAPAAPAPDPITATQVKGMVKAGLSDAQIISVIQNAPAGYSLSATELQDMLYSPPVPERVIEAMYARKAAIAAAAARGGGGGGGGAPAPPPYPASKDDGIFFLKNNAAWAPVLEERISWSERSSTMTVRKVATVGTMRNPLHGTLANESSKTLLTNPPTVVINVPSGDIHSFHLVEFQKKKGIRVVTLEDAKKASAAHSSKDFKIDAAAGGQYKITMPGGLAPGEYGIYSDRTLAKERIGKIYTFEVQ